MPATQPRSRPPSLDWHNTMLGSHRNLPLVRRPLVATGTGPLIKKRLAIGLTSSAAGRFCCKTCHLLNVRFLAQAVAGSNRQIAALREPVFGRLCCNAND